MSFELRESTHGAMLILDGRLGVRDAALLWSALQPVLAQGRDLSIHAEDMEDMDTSIVQILCRASMGPGRLEIGSISEGFQTSLRRRGLENFFVKLPPSQIRPEAKSAAKKAIKRSKPRKDGQ